MATVRAAVGASDGAPVELTTVTDTEAVLHDGARVIRVDGLRPNREQMVEGVAFRTLSRPTGQLLTSVATVSDVHIGETECGHYAGVNLGPALRADPGEAPYPETMARAAATEIAACNVEVILAKGDVTGRGAVAELDTFLAIFARPAGARLYWTNGNHDVCGLSDLPPNGRPGMELVKVAGARLVLLDTAVAGQTGGRVTDDQLAWLDDLGADPLDQTPVLVFGHHPLFDHAAFTVGINPADSDRLLELFVRRPVMAGYFAGHSHRNLVRRLPQTGDVPWAEIGATKDFPGVWAEYRIYEGGILQIVHRISSPEALAWTERTRSMFGGLYPSYSFGSLDDRCFRVS